ncbi:hypothetical protein F511_34814 [Dorcoceras hygrometricum]|uniref:LIM zinc-binding domain-containing protein n=1 Tax=Dorcoceras hygrometricum TaxID=472368 RepID=A0A2Z7D1R7_9LAMI|nr:hypothetical protein F511_34814 [Dorcoceras hygrometricum]
MGWLTKIFKGSNHKISGGQYTGRYEDDTVWEVPTTSVVFVALSLVIFIGLAPIQRSNLETFIYWSNMQDTGPDFDREEIDLAIAMSIAEEDEREEKPTDKVSHLEEDEELAKAIQESLNVESPPQSPPRALPTRPPGYDFGSFFPHNVLRHSLGQHRICRGCNSQIGNERFLSGMGAFWHPECFRCHACNEPISDHEFSMPDNRPYHKYCYKELYHPKCDVCKQFIPSNAKGEIAYREHPFWHQKYCPSHENDGTPRCSSCERMEVDCRYLILDDGRKLCLECLDSSIMDTHECQPLYLEIQEFYEGLNMKVEQQIPMLLVERQALNEAMEGEKTGHHHMPETRGLCLSEEQTIRTILRRPRIGGFRIIDLFTEPYTLIRRCEVTAILVLFGLPRLLTGSILAHEMMHAWLRLKGYPSLSPEVEEGICQVLAHMWLDSEIVPGSSNDEASSSSSFAEVSTALPSGSSKKGKRSHFEKKLGEFFKDQIESSLSVVYGDGFRQANKAVLEFGLKRTLDHIKLTGSFP